MSGDLLLIIKWWVYLFLIGLLFFPLSYRVFNSFFDKGYIFSKTLGIIFISYTSFLLGTLHILPFNRFTVFAILLGILIVNIYFFRKSVISFSKKILFLIFFQELLFFSALFLWSYIKSFQPDINGLEKFMDYGFMNSILRSSYFPPVDMWFPPLSINYYYFGHLVTALLIKLTAIPSQIGYNLMLATIFAFTVCSSFSIVSTLTYQVLRRKKTGILAGILGGVLAALGGNLHTIYAFFQAYTPADSPVPFWVLKFDPLNFPNGYWYPNATRFIPLTIHEFPSYSFVVSDLHGHVLDIPFVFLTLALIYSVFLANRLTFKITILISFMLSVMYMTNAWDGIIYFALFFMTVLLIKSNLLVVRKSKVKFFDLKGKFSSIKNKKHYVFNCIKFIGIASLGYVIFSLPFNLNFKPFVSGIGVVCAPEFLTEIGKIGPLLFEPNHCQRSPFYMLVILYGFFYFFAIALTLKILRLKKTPASFIFVLLLILLSTMLIAAPEFIYAKDIYPAHYRANTMFKLGYQAFIMLSLVSAFSIAYLFNKGKKFIWFPIAFILLILVLIYPYFAVNSYFGELKMYKGLNGISYLKITRPDDHDAILWIQKNISGQPVILEAQGDSYTDYGRISANTGLPTVLGWTVHEWLWRGDYSFPQSRLDDVRNLYEADINTTRSLIKKYDIQYVYIGTLEMEKYPNINQEKFESMGVPVYKKGAVTIYEVP